MQVRNTEQDSFTAANRNAAPDAPSDPLLEQARRRLGLILLPE